MLLNIGDDRHEVDARANQIVCQLEIERATNKKNEKRMKKMTLWRGKKRSVCECACVGAEWKKKCGERDRFRCHRAPHIQFFMLETRCKGNTRLQSPKQSSYREKKKTAHTQATRANTLAQCTHTAADPYAHAVHTFANACAYFLC